MHPILTVFLLIVGANIIYLITQKLFNLLSEWIPSMCYRFMLLILPFFKERNNDDDDDNDEEEEPEKIKTLQRWQYGSLRHRIVEYIAYLEDGKGYKITQMIWKTYLTIVPETYRTVDRESMRLDPLPYWLEQLLILSQQRRIKFSILLFAFFVIIVLCTHLWLPFIGLNGHGTTQDTLHTLFNQSIDTCHPNHSLLSIEGDVGSFCFLTQQDHIEQERLIELALRNLVFTWPADKTRKTDLIGDENQSIHYRMSMRVPTNKLWQYTEDSSNTDAMCAFLFDSWTRSSEEASTESQWIERYVHVEEELIPLLKYIHHEEVTRGAVSHYPCICPLFLNIHSNISFLFEASTERWLIMAQPTIVRNNTYAELSSSSVTSNPKSLFYKHHLHWQKYITGNLIHYDSFVIEYTELSNELLDGLVPPELTLFNSNLETLKDVHLFYRLNENTIRERRKQVRVSDRDASCFIYCETIQKRFQEKKN